MFNILGNCQFSKVLHYHQQHVSVPTSPYLPQYSLLSVFLTTAISVGVSHHGFNLHFPDGLWSWPFLICVWLFVLFPVLNSSSFYCSLKFLCPPFPLHPFPHADSHSYLINSISKRLQLMAHSQSIYLHELAEVTLLLGKEAGKPNLKFTHK